MTAAQGVMAHQAQTQAFPSGDFLFPWENPVPLPSESKPQRKTICQVKSPLTLWSLLYITRAGQMSSFKN